MAIRVPRVPLPEPGAIASPPATPFVSTPNALTPAIAQLGGAAVTVGQALIRRNEIASDTEAQMRFLDLADAQAQWEQENDPIADPDNHVQNYRKNMESLTRLHSRGVSERAAPKLGLLIRQHELARQRHAITVQSQKFVEREDNSMVRIVQALGRDEHKQTEPEFQLAMDAALLANDSKRAVGGISAQRHTAFQDAIHDSAVLRVARQAAMLPSGTALSKDTVLDMYKSARQGNDKYWATLSVEGRRRLETLLWEEYGHRVTEDNQRRAEAERVRVAAREDLERQAVDQMFDTDPAVRESSRSFIEAIKPALESERYESLIKTWETNRLAGGPGNIDLIRAYDSIVYVQATPESAKTIRTAVDRAYQAPNQPIPREVYKNYISHLNTLANKSDSDESFVARDYRATKDLIQRDLAYTSSISTQFDNRINALTSAALKDMEANNNYLGRGTQMASDWYRTNIQRYIAQIPATANAQIEIARDSLPFRLPPHARMERLTGEQWATVAVHALNDALKTGRLRVDEENRALRTIQQIHKLIDAKQYYEERTRERQGGGKPVEPGLIDRNTPTSGVQ